MKVEVLVARSSLTLCDPMNCNQAPLSMKFSRQEYWSEKKKKNTGVGCHALLQGIFPSQGPNARHLHWQTQFFTSKPHGKPVILVLLVIVTLLLLPLLATCI